MRKEEYAKKLKELNDEYLYRWPHRIIPVIRRYMNILKQILTNPTPEMLEMISRFERLIHDHKWVGELISNLEETCNSTFVANLEIERLPQGHPIRAEMMARRARRQQP